MRVLPAGASTAATAAAAVDAGELVIVPTHRWYMLCGRADDTEVTGRMFRAKRRSPDRSLLLVAASVPRVEDHFVVDEHARLLASAFWPGDLALLLRWRHPDGGTRMPAVGAAAGLVSCPGGVLGELSRLAGCPVAATSANVSPHGQPGGGRGGAPGDGAGGDPGTPPAVTVAEVHRFVARSSVAVAAVIDGGVCPHPFDMTIVDCTGPGPVVRREGIVRERAVRAVLAEAGVAVSGPG